VRTRQPLSRALLGAAGFAALPAELRELIADELNVHTLEPLEAAGAELVQYTVKPDFRALGRRFGAGTQAVAAQIRAADPAALAHAVSASASGSGSALGSGGGASASGGGSVLVDVPSVGPVTLTAADLVVTQTPLEGWGVATAGAETVALDLTVTSALRAEGYAREAVRLIQDARKSAGLEVSDRITVRWSATEPELTAAITAYAPMIAGEVLAVTFTPDGAPADSRPQPAGDPWREFADDTLGFRFRLALA
jgi:isoleucyl-tRNA synthetase